jgi:hypothetical protein
MNEFDTRQQQSTATQTQMPAEASPAGTPAGGPAAIEGLVLEPVAKGRSHRFRWAIAGSVVLIVALVTAVGAFVLSGAAGTKSLTAGVAPKSATVFMEFRIDLPGDQHQKLADFMSHFPGFADRAQFDSGLDEIFNKLTRTVVPDLAYTSAFKPWMEGEVSIAALPGNGMIGVPSLGSLASGATDMPFGMLQAPREDGIVIVALKDRAAAQSWIDGELASVHVTTASQTYAGETMYTITGVDEGAYALTSQDLIVGTVDGVKAALDSKTNGSLADDADYQAAMSSLSGDALARFYMSPRATLQPYTGFFGSLAQAAGATAALDLNNVPAWMAGSVRAESDRMVLEMTASSGGSGSGNHSSAIASYLPGDSVAVAEAHSVGNELTKVLDEVSALAPKTGQGASELKQVTDTLSLIGGVDWIQDVAVAITDTNGTVGGGVVVQTPDASTARSKVALLTSAVALAGGSLGLKSSTESYNGGTITVVTVPADAAHGTPAVEIGVTTRDNMIVAGCGDSFAKAVIDTTSSTALSAQSDYQSVMDAVGASNAGSVYVNVPALEDQLGRMAMDPSNWSTNYKPYFDHVGGIGFASIDGSTSTMRAVVMAR